MAPRRSGQSAICGGAFAHIEMQLSLAYSILFSLVFFFIFAALFFVRKRSGRTGKTLVSTAYISAVVMMFISNVLDTVSLILISCLATNHFTYLSMVVASNVLYALATWCLLFVAVYILNELLTQYHHLGRGQQSSPVVRVVPLAIVTVMLPLICAGMGLWGYNAIMSDAKRSGGRNPMYGTSRRLSLAVRAMYLVGVCAGAVLAGLSVKKMRTRRVAGGGLIVWVAVLFFSMLLWNIISLTRAAETLRGITWSWGADMAQGYVQGAFQALAFITLMGIAKHPSWKSMEDAAQQEYSPVGQQYATTTTMYEGAQDHYQQPAIYEAPVYVHAK
ncbi:hypothetical protein PTT_07962 [Pyrenophora teres f. teres 0-1]|uniref:Uncharacterized protein n=2 Tax=Pyrenophora teres f. teres TaxID=97479 RepID=E3RIT1_PYRTT|nr:hypothetical protein PTT_07962 [Pyrenophora teres f. teres 0-1]KAE8835788.1 hypothetical protein HRS9139_03886 [Pyrenophora teres f. teres]KAE8863066.1 hypothetical protein PTNB29_05628 [Pyrenophora teres f. teres]CAE7000116.1 hypothetical protein PTTW11_01009 [Pyrenophora teres f. teres]